MFDDPRKELERLQRQLLDGQEEKMVDDLLSDAYRLLGEDTSGAPRTPAVQPRTKPVPSQTWDMEDEEDAPEKSPRRDYDEKGGRIVTGLLLLLCLELLGIGAVVVYWLLFLM